MKLRNRDGVLVDPVPWFVVTAVAFAVAYSFGPGYFAAFGVPIDHGLVLSTGLFAVTTVVTYYRFVWTVSPNRRKEVPVGDRFERLVLATLTCLGVVVLLALPLVMA